VVTGCPTGTIVAGNQPGDLGAVVFWGAITAQAVGNASVTVTVASAPRRLLTNGSNFPLGETEVTYSFTDPYHNTVECVFLVVVTNTDGCLPPTDCSPNAFCTDLAPGEDATASHLCTCNRGFSGDGIQCTVLVPPGAIFVSVVLNRTLASLGVNFTENFLMALAADTDAPEGQFDILGYSSVNNGTAVNVTFLISSAIAGDSSAAAEDPASVLSQFQSAVQAQNSELSTFAPESGSVTTSQSSVGSGSSSSKLKPAQIMGLLIGLFLAVGLILLLGWFLLVGRSRTGVEESA